MVGGHVESGRHGAGPDTTARLFVAVWPNEQAVAHLREAVAAVRPGAGAELRWQPDQRWHLTVAFLGQAEPARTAARLERITRPTAEPLRLAGAGTFGPVLWIGVEHGDWLPDLAANVRSALHVDEHRYRAHLTVARARGPRAVAVARAAAPPFAAYRGPVWVPDAVTLVRSWTGPDPRYEVVGAWSFLDSGR